MVGENCFRTIRYKTLKLDENYKNRRNLNVFTQSERQFLERYKLLEKYQDLPGTVELTQLFNVFNEELKKKTLTLLKECEVKDGSVYSSNLPEFIPYIRCMLHFFPDIKKDVEKACQDFSTDILCGIYQTASSSYLQSIATSLDLQRDTFGLSTFLENNNLNLLHTIQSSTSLGAVKVHKTLNIAGIDYYKGKNHVFLNLDRIFYLGQEMYFNFLKKINYKYLFVVECDDSLNDKIKGFLEELFKTLQDNHNANAKHLKVVLATEKGSDLSKFVSEFVRVHPSKCQEEENEVKLTDLTADSRKKLLEKTVIFQGREISLSAVVTVSDTLDTIIDPATIVELYNKNEIEIGKTLPSLGETEKYYIDRKLVKKVKVKEEVLKEDHLTDLFAISHISKEELSELVSGRRVRSFSEEDPDRSNPIRFINLNEDEKKKLNEDEKKKLNEDEKKKLNEDEKKLNEDEKKKLNEENFKKLCDVYSDCTIHWLENNNNVGLIWKRSYGKTLSGLRKYIENYESDLPDDEYTENNSSIKMVDVNDISKFEERLIVVAAEPGMGKTTALTHLEIQNTDYSKWLIRINLADYKDKLKQRNFTDVASIVTFLLGDNDNTVSKALTKRLLISRLNLNGNISILLDGFDEIIFESQKKVVNLIKILQETKVEKVIITTRLHLRNELENSLSTVAYTLKPFSPDDQKQFLKKFWKKDLNPSIDTEHLDNCINKLLEFISKSIGSKERRFMGVPLQIRMVAEAFQEVTKDQELLDHPERTFPENFNMLKLFKRFLYTKYRVYFEKRGAENIDLDHEDEDWLTARPTKVHRSLALKVLFPQMEKAFVKEALSERDKQRVNLVGIAQITNDGVIFTHRTFAEYFVAGFLAHRLKKGENNQKYQATIEFLAKELFESKNEVIRTFLDYHLAKKETHVAVLRGKLTDDRENVNVTDALGRTVLHYGAQEEYDEIVGILMNNDVDVRKTDKLGKTALHYAARYNHGTQVVNRLLENVNDFINAKDKNGRTAVYYAAQQGNWDIVDRILKEKGASTEDLDKEKLLFHYTYKGNLDGIQNVIGGEEMDVTAIRDKHDNTLLHIATQKGYSTIVEFLLEKGADVCAVNNSSKRPISYAAEERHWTIAEFLLRKKANFDDLSDPQKLSLLKHATENSHWDIVKLFMIDNGRDNYFNYLDGQQSMELLRHSILLEDSCIVEFLMEKYISTDEYIMRPIYYKLFTDNRDRNIYFDHLSDKLKIRCLCYFISAGDLDVTRFFIEALIGNEKIRDVNFPSNSGKTFLHLATQFGKSNVVQYLVKEKGADLNAATDRGSTPLHLAARNNRLQVAEYLIKRGANLNAAETNGKIPRDLAAENGFLEMVEKLMLCAEDVDKDRWSTFPLQWASRKNYFALLERLIEKSLDVDAEARCDEEGSGLLHYAALCGSLDMAEKLIAKGADVDSANEKGRTPLHFAALHGRSDMAEKLIEGGACVDAIDNNSYTPLHLAALSGHSNAVEKLIERGANVNACDVHGFTLLHIATINGRLNVIEKLLLKEEGVDENSNKDGPLHIAATNGESGAAEELADFGIRLDRKDKNGLTAIHWTCMTGHRKIAEVLVAKGADVYSVDNDGRKPIHVAALRGHTDVIELLLSIRVDVDTTDKDGSTPLHYAVCGGKLEVLNFLLSRGADIVGQRKNGRTALHVLMAAEKFRQERRSIVDIYNILGPSSFDHVELDVDYMTSYFEKDVDDWTGIISNTSVKCYDRAKELFNQGKYKKALETFKLLFCLQKRPHSLGPKNPSTLMTRVNIAAVLSKMGKYEDALKILKEVLDIQKGLENIGRNHRDTLTTRHTIAEVFYKQGKYKDALELYTEVLEKRKEILNANHPDVLITRHHMARVLNNQRQHRKALSMFREIFESQCNVLGADHPDTLKTEHNIAFTLYRLGKYQEASSAIQKVLKKSAKVLKANHPDYLTTRHVEALCLLDSGKYEAALNILKDIFQIQAEIVGPDHSDALATKHDIAYAFYLQGKTQEALRKFRETYEKRKEVLGPDHLYTSYSYDCMQSIEFTNTIKKCSIQRFEKRQKAFLELSKFVSSRYSSHAEIESVKQGLYLPSFKERGVKINGKCVAITRGLSQTLFLRSEKSFLNNLTTSAEIYERIAQGKQISLREEREVFAFSKLLDGFEQQLDSATNSLPSILIRDQGLKTFHVLSNDVAGVKGDFAIHLVTSGHVVAIYRTGENYAYFDSNTAFVSGLKSVGQLMEVVEKAVEYAGYILEEKGFLVEHFCVGEANNILSDRNKQVLTKEIKTERRLLAEQDEKFGLVKINGQELSRVQLYDFGTKVNVEGSVPLLINADLNLSSKTLQDLLDKKEISMTAREYLGNLKDCKNGRKEVVKAARGIPSIIGSIREIEDAELTCEQKQSSLQQLVKEANYLATFFSCLRQSARETVARKIRRLKSV